MSDEPSYAPVAEPPVVPSDRINAIAYYMVHVPEFKIGGTYRHFKGNHYQIKDLVVETSGQDEGLWKVVYVKTLDPREVFVRSIHNFFEKMPDGIARFELVFSPSLEEKAPAGTWVSKT